MFEPAGRASTDAQQDPPWASGLRAGALCRDSKPHISDGGKSKYRVPGFQTGTSENGPRRRGLRECPAFQAASPPPAAPGRPSCLPGHPCAVASAQSAPPRQWDTYRVGTRGSSETASPSVAHLPQSALPEGREPATRTGPETLLLSFLALQRPISTQELQPALGVRRTLLMSPTTLNVQYNADQYE